MKETVYVQVSIKEGIEKVSNGWVYSELKFQIATEYEKSMKGEIMSKYHCLDCGTELETLNVSMSCDKYYCKKCKKSWFRNIRMIVEWVKEKS